MKDFDSNCLTEHLCVNDDDQSVEERAELTTSTPRKCCCFVGPVLIRKVAKSFSKPFSQLARRSWRRKKRVAIIGHTSLTEIIEHVPPILFTIIDFIADRPRNAVRLSCWTASFIHAETRIAAHLLWSTMYERRWPAFHDALSYMGKGKLVDWCTRYRETLFGKTKLILEVYHRELKRGYSMSVMPAHVRFDAKLNAYRAEYISASRALPETIPATDNHRLRFCSAGTRERLELNFVAQQQLQDQNDSASCYPYQVLQGTDDLVPGKSVEVQWKMQRGSPFGWWHGSLESIAYEDNGPHATATVTFAHFPRDSHWHRMQVRCGDSEVRANDYGGFTGGIRACSDAEARHWKRFCPKTPFQT